MTGMYKLVAPDGTEVSVCHLPDRKRPCLVTKSADSNIHYIVASFNGEEGVERFVETMNEILGKAKWIDEELD